MEKKWAEVSVFASLIDARLGKWLTTHHGVGLTEYWALMYLAESPTRELRVNDLAAKIGLNQSSVTRLLGRLEAKGLSLRDTCPHDGRGVFAVITDKGQQLLDSASEAFGAEVERLLGGVSKPDSGECPGLDGAHIREAFMQVGKRIV